MQQPRTTRALAGPPGPSCRPWPSSVSSWLRCPARPGHGGHGPTMTINALEWLLRVSLACTLQLLLPEWRVIHGRAPRASDSHHVAVVVGASVGGFPWLWSDPMALVVVKCVRRRKQQKLNHG
uniref:Uncharacterized protein n=1 Tax=Sphaerodactylus townsendi TaxID=933632 RepID=A0ACB8EZC2_9SAUR